MRYFTDDKPHGIQDSDECQRPDHNRDHDFQSKSGKVE